MTLVYSIGQYRFINLSGNPEGAKEATQLQTRPGVDDVAVWLTGRRGEPFTMQSVVDTDTFAQTTTLMQAYRDLVGTAQRMLYASQDMGIVMVLDVKRVEAIRMASKSGGLSALGGGLLTAEWTLVVKISA